MDRVILADKLDSLGRCVARIEARRAESADQLRGDTDRQDIVSLNLTRAVQISVDIAVHVLIGQGRSSPKTMGEAFDQLAAVGLIPEDLRLRLRAAVGFRNVAVHSYRAIDWDIVHAISHRGLEDFRAFAAAMGRLL